MVVIVSMKDRIEDIFSVCPVSSITISFCAVPLTVTNENKFEMSADAKGTWHSMDKIRKNNS